MKIHFSSASWPGTGTEAFKNLKNICLKRLANRFSGPKDRGIIPQTVLAELEKELLQFHQAGILPAIAQLAKAWDSLEKAGRNTTTTGAACSSLVLFGVGLIPFCPSDHGLAFERIRLEGLLSQSEWIISVGVEPDAMAELEAFPQDRTSVIGKHLTLMIQEDPRLAQGSPWRKIQPTQEPPNTQQIREAIQILNEEGPKSFGMRDEDFLEFVNRVNPESLEEWVLCRELFHPTRRNAGWPTIYLNRMAKKNGESPSMNREGAILAGTGGLPVYQEDLMRILHEVIGMEWGKSYGFILALSSKMESKIQPALKEYFECAKRTGVAEIRAKGILCLVEVGASKAICKANAIAKGYRELGEMLKKKSQVYPSTVRNFL